MFPFLHFISQYNNKSFQTLAYTPCTRRVLRTPPCFAGMTQVSCHMQSGVARHRLVPGPALPECTACKPVSHMLYSLRFGLDFRYPHLVAPGPVWSRLVVRGRILVARGCFCPLLAVPGRSWMLSLAPCTTTDAAGQGRRGACA